MHKRARQAVTAALAGTTLLLGTATTAAQAAVTPQAPPTASLSPADAPRPVLDPVAIGSALNAALRAAAADAKRIAALPSGKATATSFWDASTASGKRMRYATLASPYWPLGTKVKITYRGKSAVGVVEDFGPAEWAVAQHDIPAIVDLSEKMMADLTGVASNTVHVRFQVLKWGKGRVYRHSGTGYDLAMGRS
ncbi:hypothetical protein [Microbispora triticiradicis]|uniref:RlpA-like protein double-psi beta-barrel domain-containing protein n=2 Tax=Microbispora TaxID=2005 RepID=A0ABY3LWF4_9ACTN|nr:MULTISPECIES: hypothetical protein [Microbispora]TLP58615.1 hypothetical protein FED44_17240 [Microbispora fusca]TYB57741.1 hypothetical protein FXF59_18090 [Microbispora tritici]